MRICQMEAIYEMSRIQYACVFQIAEYHFITFRFDFLT